MQFNTVEKMRCRRIRDSKAVISNNKNDKMLRRNRMLHRAIKQGEFQESNTLDKGERE